MHDQNTPFNPHDIITGPRIVKVDGVDTLLPAGCCQSGCGCGTTLALDSHAVLIKVPVGFTPYDLNAPGTPIMDGDTCIGEHPAGGEEQFEDLYLTVGQLKELFGATLCRGNYQDTIAQLRRVRRELPDLDASQTGTKT